MLSPPTLPLEGSLYVELSVTVMLRQKSLPCLLPGTQTRKILSVNTGIDH